MTRFVTLDVFTDTRFCGNPLAVVPDARTLDPSDFQKIAREFNYSETAFVLPPADPANDAHVRIFTPNEEMPFAGHPNVGTAFALGAAGHVLGRAVGDTLRFEEQAGLVTVRLERRGGTMVAAHVRAPRPLAEGAARAVADVAALAGLPAGAVRLAIHPPLYASVGAGFLFAEVAADALPLAAPRVDAFVAERERLAADGAGAALPALMLWARGGAGEGPVRLHARMFAPLSGIAEDPATGSAAGALGALLEARGLGAAFAIRQGKTMGRPSEIHVAVADDGVWIGGQCVPVHEGHMLP